LVCAPLSLRFDIPPGIDVQIPAVGTDEAELSSAQLAGYSVFRSDSLDLGLAFLFPHAVRTKNLVVYLE